MSVRGISILHRIANQAETPIGRLIFAGIILAFFQGAGIGQEEKPTAQYQWQDISIPLASSREPLLEEFSLDRALGFIESAALVWTRKHECISCHTNATYMVTRPALVPIAGKPSEEIREFFVQQLHKYQSLDREKLLSDIQPTQVAYLAQGLAEWDTHVTGNLSPETEAALALLFQAQSEKGDWSNLPRWPPLESSNYHSTTVAAMAAATAPGWLSGVTDEAIRSGIDKMKRYLKTAAVHDYHRLLLLWTAARMPGLLKRQEMDALIQTVWKHQREDGGWSIRTFSEPESWGSGNRSQKLRAEPEFLDPPSDGHQTGLCVLVLREAGVPVKDPRIGRAVSWLLANQRESGRWWTRSLNTDTYHYITYSGTSYPLLALAKCDALPRR